MTVRPNSITRPKLDVIMNVDVKPIRRAAQQVASDMIRDAGHNIMKDRTIALITLSLPEDPEDRMTIGAGLIALANQITPDPPIPIGPPIYPRPSAC